MASAANTKAGKRNPRERDLQTYRDIADDVIESDFVPYACLMDPATIATKNGELLQIIKIAGLSFDGKEHGDLRAAIRAAIADRIPDTNYAIWLHTLRREQTLVKAMPFPDTFSREVDAAWRAQHPAQASFVNELYITVVRAAQQANLSNIQALLQSLWPPRDRRERAEYLTQSLRELSATVESMLGALRPFGARVLSIVEREDGFYAEHLEFLEKLMNLESRAMDVPRRDLSQVLTSGDLSFGYNALEVRTAENHRRFAAILTIKEYKESSLAGIDTFLDIPCELIVTQCFDFVGAEMARSRYQKQAKYLAISGDAEFAKWVEIDRLTDRTRSTGKAFGEQQTSVFVIAPSVKQLESNIRLVQRALAKLGIVAFREDLRLEDCYWAQLPANFPFIARRYSTDTRHIAGFANLQRQPMGNAQGSPWGAPVTLFSTLQGTPYFFNFHRQHVAHTLILGQARRELALFTHFLLTQTRKLSVNIWYLDSSGKGRALMEAMGTSSARPGSPSLKLNPFALEATPGYREFLSRWLALLIDPSATTTNASLLHYLRTLVDTAYAMPTATRRLSALLPIVREQDALLASRLQRFTAGGEYGELFDMPTDAWHTETLTHWDLSAFSGVPHVYAPLAAYLLYRITHALDGTPTLVVMEDGVRMLANPLMQPHAGEWLDALSSRNAAALITTSAIAEDAAFSHTAQLAEKAASIFALPDAEAGDAYQIFGLDERDQGAIAYFEQANQPHVLLKRGGDATPLLVELRHLPPATRQILLGIAPQNEPPAFFAREGVTG